jgi:hypothetical protein
VVNKSACNFCWVFLKRVPFCLSQSYLISAGIINKISNCGYGCAGEAGDPGAEEERPDEQYENRNSN